MSKKNVGWVGFNREVLTKIYRILDEGAQGPGRPPRLDVCKHLVLIMAIHSDYEDVPAQGRAFGVWRTSYPEIENLTGYNKRTTELALMYMEKQQLIQKANKFTHYNNNKRATTDGINVPRELVITVCFYRHLTTVDEGFRCWLEENKRAVFKEVPPASPPFPLKSLKSETLQNSQVHGTGIAQNGHVASAGGRSFKNYFSGKSQNQPPTTVPTTPSPNNRGRSKNRAGEVTSLASAAAPVVPAGRGQKKLVTRKAMSMQEARVSVAANLRPTLNLLESLGITHTYETHLSDLCRTHSAFLKVASDDDARLGRTALYLSLQAMATSGQTFGSIPDAVEAVKADAARKAG